MRRAIIFLYRHAAELGIDKNAIFLSGHSSGAHLASCLLTHEWSNDDIPPDIFKGAVLASDLRPVRLSKRSIYVRFTDEVEEKLSAARNLDKLKTPVIVAHGTEESPEFQRQARDFAAAIERSGRHVCLLVGDGYNHFEIMETFSNPFRLLGRASLEQMNVEKRRHSKK